MAYHPRETLLSGNLDLSDCIHTATAAAATNPQVDDEIKFGMIEAISHLIHRDYEAIVQDFVTLQFIPPGTDLQPILPVLAKVFDQVMLWYAGVCHAMVIDVHLNIS
eukprot:GHUV01027645.1.p1 GENE.GHUV01027645.1~~GHUV01027645.1.p1  ORF type:complete len:107 (+),score=23.85 GHUV01027645.1:140-460(+)